jgi:hypothetical protein
MLDDVGSAAKDAVTSATVALQICHAMQLPESQRIF